MVKAASGIMVISLDFELMWGMLDSVTIEGYGPNIIGARAIIPEILTVFREREIHATWAVVGALFARSRDDYMSMLPEKRPRYKNPRLSNYDNYETVSQKHGDKTYFFANTLIQMISRTPNQEVGSHTFSHYYCTEPGQTYQDFAWDLGQARKVAEDNGVNPKSLVLPRNQYNPVYREALLGNGFVCYRGNESSWMYRSGNIAGENPLKRVLRLVDAYINISGHNCYPLTEARADGHLRNIRSSRFLRPFSPRFRRLEPLKIKRVKSQMLHAAEHSEVFHLWWHPHNFGVNTEENLGNLRSILDHYAALHERFGFRSLNMSEASAAAPT